MGRVEMWIRATAIMIGLLAATSPAAALDVACIEGSRYKHFATLFGGEPEALARYLDWPAGMRPHPEHCRAALVTGGITTDPKDAEKLLAFILQQQGWLAELQLGSPGGSVTQGLTLGYLTRAFWLKSRTVQVAKGQALVYQPDFAPAPPALDQSYANLPPMSVPAPGVASWKAYQALQSGLAPIMPQRARCASACGMMATAGSDRSGPVFVHRARYSRQTKPATPGAPNAPPPPSQAPRGSDLDVNRSMARTDEGLIASERANVAFYERMDAGEAYIRTFRATSALITTSAQATRFPRFVQDFLSARCESDPEQLRQLDLQLRAATAQLTTRGAGVRLDLAPLNQSLFSVFDRRRKVEQCVAAANERERMTAFGKQCARGCDAAAILRAASEQTRDLRERASR
jgi:hypothetical protein